MKGEWELTMICSKLTSWKVVVKLTLAGGTGASVGAGVLPGTGAAVVCG